MGTKAQRSEVTCPVTQQVVELRLKSQSMSSEHLTQLSFVGFCFGFVGVRGREWRFLSKEDEIHELCAHNSQIITDKDIKIEQLE